MRKEYMSALRVICALGVVLLHSNEAIWMFSYEPYWVEATVVFMLFLAAVPCFIMVSGALLIDYSERYSLKTFLKKRAEKTLVPYIAWCLIGTVYLAYYGVLPADSLTVRGVLQMILHNTVLPPYWFFTAIFGCYLITPILTAIPKDKKKHVLGYIITAMALINIVAPFLLQFIGIYNIEIQVPISTIILYYMVGYYIDKYPAPRKVQIGIYILSAASLAVMIFGTIYASYKDGCLVETYKSYTGLPCFLYSVGVFSAFKNAHAKKIEKHRGGSEGDQRSVRIISLFVDETFGIFLVHWYVLNEIKHHFCVIYSDFAYRIPLGIAAFFISWLIVKVLRRIPVVKRIVP